MFGLLRHVPILSVIVLSFSSIVDGQVDYSLPRAVALDPIVRRSFRSFYVRSYPGGPIQRLYTDGFFPIGWSRDGKFAYYSEPVDEECGCYYAELTIVDLRTDKIVWEFKNKPQDRMDEKGQPIADDMRKLWTRNEKLFTEKLREHNIQQVPRFALLPATFRWARKSYTERFSAPR